MNDKLLIWLFYRLLFSLSTKVLKYHQKMWMFLKEKKKNKMGLKQFNVQVTRAHFFKQVGLLDRCHIRT